MPGGWRPFLEAADPSVVAAAVEAKKEACRVANVDEPLTSGRRGEYRGREGERRSEGGGTREGEGEGGREGGRYPPRLSLKRSDP